MFRVDVETLERLVEEIRGCRICAPTLPHEPRPVVSVHADSRVLVAGQAPGRRVHASGVAWADPSGARLREWMGIDDATFYDATQVALVPMGFCYPGSGRSGDLAPRVECRETWHPRLLPALTNVRLTLLVGQYAQAFHLRGRRRRNLTETVRAWRDFAPAFVPLPHPSPRNGIWLRRNPWFGQELLPELRRVVAAALG